MKIVFADTGYWVAVLNPKDDWNTRANEVSRSLGKVRIVTTEMVLAELLSALSKLPVRTFAVRGAERIRTDPNIEVVPQTSLQFGEAFAAYKRLVDKEWSLVDCASFEVMRSRGISEALAHDHHFEQAGFRALLREHANP
jgi:predicted nucleic acid-binding protein